MKVMANSVNYDNSSPDQKKSLSDKMRCYLGFLLCALALTATATPSGNDLNCKSPVGKCPPVNGAYPVLLPDAVDRNCFYICDGGRPIPQRCSPGLVFDPDIKTCKFKEQVVGDEQVPTPYSPVGKCPEVDGLNPVYLPDSENNTIFYECSNGIPIQQQCAPDLVFDTTFNVCVYP